MLTSIALPIGHLEGHHQLLYEIQPAQEIVGLLSLGRKNPELNEDVSMSELLAQQVQIRQDAVLDSVLHQKAT